MDGDRPVVDGRNIFEFELQNLVRKVWDDACKYGDGLRYAGVDKKVFLNRYDHDIHKLLISYFDGPSGDVGTQDEAPEEGAMGDGVRSESDLSPFLTYEDPIRKIEDEFAKEMSDDWRVYQALHPNAKLVPVFEKEEQPDGSVTYRLIYKPVVTYDV